MSGDLDPEWEAEEAERTKEAVKKEKKKKKEEKKAESPRKDEPKYPGGEFSIRAKARRIKAVFGALGSSIKDALFLVDSERLYMKALDPSHVSLAVLNLPADTFEGFEAKGAMRVPISLDELNKYLARARPEDLITIRHSSKTNKLTLHFAGGGISSKTFNVPLSRLDIEEAPEPPPMKFDIEIDAIPDLLVELVKDCKVVSPHITLYSKKGQFGASASDQGVSGDFSYPEEGLLRTESKRDAKATYTLEYLIDMAKMARASQTVSICFSDDKPIKVTFNLTDGGTCTYLLAPRLEPDFS